MTKTKPSERERFTVPQTWFMISTLSNEITPRGGVTSCTDAHAWAALGSSGEWRYCRKEIFPTYGEAQVGLAYAMAAIRRRLVIAADEANDRLREYDVAMRRVHADLPPAVRVEAAGAANREALMTRVGLGGPAAPSGPFAVS